MGLNLHKAEISSSLDSVIMRLAMTCDSDDKELNVLSEALSAALECIKDNEVALAAVAKAVKDELGDTVEDISFVDSEGDIRDLESYISAG